MKRFLFAPTTSFDFEELEVKARKMKLASTKTVDFADSYTRFANKIGVVFDASDREKRDFVEAAMECKFEGYLYELPDKIQDVEGAFEHIENTELEHSEYI